MLCHDWIIGGLFGRWQKNEETRNMSNTDYWLTNSFIQQIFPSPKLKIRPHTALFLNERDRTHRVWQKQLSNEIKPHRLKISASQGLEPPLFSSVFSLIFR